MQKGLKSHSNTDDIRLKYQSPKGGNMSDLQSNMDTQSRFTGKEQNGTDKRQERPKQSQISKKLMSNMLELKTTMKQTNW